MLKLYYSPNACAMASHIALEESGADFQREKIDLKRGQQKTAEFLAVTPIGKTPALQTDEGVLTENLVIMGYIARAYPQARLADLDDSFAFDRMQAFNGFLASGVHPVVGPLIFARPPFDQEALDARKTLALSRYDLIETSLFKGPWVMGDAFTVADGYLYVFTRWARWRGLLDAARYPKLNDHLDRMQARPAVQRMLKTEELEPV